MAPAASVEKAVLSPLHCFCKKSFGHVSVGCLIFLNIKVSLFSFSHQFYLLCHHSTLSLLNCGSLDRFSTLSRL